MNGLRPLLASEYAAAPAANVNLRLAANRVADDTVSINSLLLADGVTYDHDATGAANTLTIASGNVLSVGGTNTIQPTQATGTVAFGATDAKLFTVSDLILGSNAQVTGTGILGKAGSGVLQENRSVARTGGIVVNSGTLRSGINSAFASQAMTVRAAGALNLNGFNHTVSSLTLESGATSGATVTTGAGTLTLGGNVTLNVNGTGTTGAIVSGNLASTATRTFTVNNGSAVDDLTVAAVISGAGGVTKAGAGTLALARANTYTGATTIQNNGGTLSANTLANGTKATAGTVTLTRANNYTGATTVNGGILSVSSLANGGTASNIGASTNAAGNLVLGGGILQYTGASVATDRNYTLTAGSTSSIGVLNAATSLTIGGASAATTGALTKLGDGTLTLTGANANTGTTTIRAGTLQVGNGGATGNLGTGAVVNLGKLTFNRNNALTSANVVSSFGELIQQGSGTTTLTGANTYTGATTISAGTLQLGAANRISDVSAVTVASGATFNLANFSETVGSIAGAGNIALGSGTLTSGGNNATTTFAGVISGTGGIAKAGTGTLTLSGANTYSGVTSIGSGTLVAANASALGAASGGTTVATGATLNVDNVAIVGEPISLNGVGVAGAGALTGQGTASVSGSVTLASASTIGTMSAASSLTLGGVVSAPSALTIVGPGSVTATNAGNNFGAVSVPGAGSVSLRDTNAITINASTVSGTLSVRAGGAVTVAGVISAAGAGDAIVLSGSRFINSVGSTALSATNGRWLVWSSNSNPFGGATPDTRNGLAYDFKQYSAVFGITPVAQATGNGILYSLAPSLTPDLTGTTGKVYDGTTGATLLAGNFTAAGAVDGDAVTLAWTGSAFGDRNVGIAKAVTATGITASASNAGAPVYGYTLASTTATANIGQITPAALTVTAQADTRVYDGTTASSAAPLLSGATYDAVGTAATQSFDNRHAGTGKHLAASGLVMDDGNGGANYAINYVDNAAGVITPAALTVTAQADSRVYDGTTASSAAPLLSGATYDAVGTAATQSFDDRHAGTGKHLAASGLVMDDGNGGANYAINYVDNAAGVITPAALTVTAQADSRVYDGTTASSAAPLLSGATYDAVGTAATQSFDDRHAGTGKHLVASGLVMDDGNGGANYAINYVDNAAGVITPAALTVTAQADSRVYDGTTASSAAPLLSGATYDAVGTAATQSFDDRHAGTGKHLAASGLVMDDGNGGANYAINYVDNAAGVITPAALTVTAQADSRVYDGTTASSAAPLLSGATYDAVGTAATQSFDDRHAGTGKHLAASGLVMDDGNGGANYAINYVDNAAGVITPAALTVTAQADSRVYDGTTASSAAPLLSGATYDAVGTAATQSFDDRHAGTGKHLAASGLVMDDGNGGANYAINYVDNAAGVITPAALTVTAQADSRVYDGTTASSAAPLLSGATYDAVGTAATQSFDDRHAGTGKHLAASGLVMDDGNGLCFPTAPAESPLAAPGRTRRETVGPAVPAHRQTTSRVGFPSPRCS